jgi:hypothetical protein
MHLLEPWSLAPQKLVGEVMAAGGEKHALGRISSADEQVSRLCLIFSDCFARQMCGEDALGKMETWHDASGALLSVALAAAQSCYRHHALCLHTQAAVIVFLASAGAGFITGTNIMVDGGLLLQLDAVPKLD